MAFMGQSSFFQCFPMGTRFAYLLCFGLLQLLDLARRPHKVLPCKFGFYMNGPDKSKSEIKMIAPSSMVIFVVCFEVLLYTIEMAAVTFGNWSQSNVKIKTKDICVSVWQPRNKMALLLSSCLADGAKLNDPCLVCGQLVRLTTHAPLPRLWWPIDCDKTKLSRGNKVVQTPYSLASLRPQRELCLGP